MHRGGATGVGGGRCPPKVQELMKDQCKISEKTVNLVFELFAPVMAD
jgi:hypothetical protein